MSTTSVPAIPRSPAVEAEPEIRWRHPEIAPESPPFAPMVARGYLLILATLGLYRFWLVRDLRRWYRSHTIVEGERFEYLGTAQEHLRGFLIALTIALPLNALAFVLNIILGAIASELIWVTFAGMTYLLTYAAYRAQRFQFSRTSWRGIRFGLDGSGWRYANRISAWQALTVLTIGLAYPWQSAASFRLRYNNLRYGNARASIEIRGRDLFRPWIKFWFSGLGLAALVLFVIIVGLDYIPWFPNFGDLSEGMQISIFALSGIMAFMLVWPLYSTEEFRISMQKLSVGPLRFRSNLSVWDVFGQYFVYAMLVAGVTGLGIWLLASEVGSSGDADWWSQLRYGLLYTAIGLGSAYILGIGRELLVTRVFWRASVASLAYHGLDELLPQVEAVADDVNATGEGFLDTLGA